jgi:hypothetical protein
MNDAQQHVAAALRQLESAITRFAEAAACVQAQGLKDFDARSAAVARTHAETSAMWARQALE